MSNTEMIEVVDELPPVERGGGGHRGDSLWVRRLKEVAQMDPKEDGTYPWAKFGPYRASSILRTVRNASEKYSEERGRKSEAFEYTTRMESGVRGDGEFFVYVRYTK